MENQLATVQHQAAHLTAADVRAHVNLIQQVMESVMIGPSSKNPQGVHYGTIPGTPKPTLYKAGAEKILETFKIAPSYIIDDLSGNGFVRYRIRCIGTHYVSGQVLGEGMGECSSLEEKYKWRKAASRAEFENTPEDQRRIKYGYNRSERQEYQIQQVRTEPADLANTILKMACKRALVHMAITVTAASDIFTQDLEDLPEELRPEPEQTQTVQQPQTTVKDNGAEPEKKKEAPKNTNPIQENQMRVIRAALKGSKHTEEDLCKHFGIKALGELRMDQLNNAMAWARKKD